MASSKLCMSDFMNVDSFPYKIKNGIILYGPIYNLQAKNKIRLWKIEIELFDDEDKKINIGKKMIMSFNKEGYYTNIRKITHYMDDNAAIQDILSDVITEGKNIGKSNETNIIQQSLIKARGYYLKKLNAGFVKDLDDVQKPKTNDQIPFPMAVNSYDKHKKKLTYPCYIQPKLDGIRAIIHKDNNTNKLIITSRRHKEINGFNDLINELTDNKQIRVLFNLDTKKDSTLFLDGELYTHDLTLQNISGIVRKPSHPDKHLLQFYMFDLFDISQPKLTFEERNNLIIQNFSNLNNVIIVETKLINSEEEGDDEFYTYLNDKYEGAIYKPRFRHYEFSFDKEIRSNYYLKRKPTFDSEFKIVGYELDKNDCIIFVLKTDKDIEFKSVPMWTLDERKTFLKRENFKKNYLNKYGTVKYDDLSDDGVPVRSRFVALRINES